MSAPQYLDRGTLRELILDFYTINDPQRLRDGIDINGMVNWTFDNGLQALNDMLYEQYGTEIDPYKRVNYNSTENFKRVSAALVATPLPPVADRADIEARLTRFYQKHDKSKLGSLEKLINFALYKGVDMLNARLMGKYGEDLNNFGADDKHTEPSVLDDDFPTAGIQAPPPPVMNIGGQQFSAMEEEKIEPPKSAFLKDTRVQSVAPPPPPMDDNMSVMLPPPPPMEDFVDPDTIEDELIAFYKAHDPGKLTVVDALAAWVIKIGRIKYNEKLLQLYGYTLDDPIPEEKEEKQEDLMTFNAPVERKPELLDLPKKREVIEPPIVVEPPVSPPTPPRDVPPVIPRAIEPPNVPPPVTPRVNPPVTNEPPPVTPRINPPRINAEPKVETNPFKQPLLAEREERKPIFSAPDASRGRQNFPSVLMDQKNEKNPAPKADLSILSSDRFATKKRDKAPQVNDLNDLKSPGFGNKRGFKPPPPASPPVPRSMPKNTGFKPPAPAGFPQSKNTGFKPPAPVEKPKPTPVQKPKFSKPKPSNNGVFTPMPPLSPGLRTHKAKPKAKAPVPVNTIKSTSFNKAAECEGFRLNMTATSFGMCVCGRPRAAHKRLQAGINVKGKKKPAPSAVSRVNIPGKSRFGPPPPNYKVSKKPAYGNI